MIDVRPYGPSYRIKLDFHSTNGANFVGGGDANAWIGCLYILAPFEYGAGYRFERDAIRTTDCPISPRYHNCSHQKYSGNIDVEPFESIYYDDVERIDVVDSSTYKHQPLFANSFSSSIEVQGYTRGPYRYVIDSKKDKGYHYYEYSCTQCRIFPTYGEDPSYPEKLTMVYSYRTRHYWVPDEGMITHDDVITEATKSIENILTYRRIHIVKPDRVYDKVNVSYDDASKLVDRVIRQYNRDRSLLQHDIEADIPYSRLIYKAAENIRLLDINMISFIKEQSEMIKGGFLKTLFHRDAAQEFDALLKNRNVKKLKKLRKTVKFAASEYLGMHYGTKLTALDYSDLMEAHLKMQEMLYATQTMGAVERRSYLLSSGTSVNVVRRFKGEIQSLTDEDLTIVEASDKFVRELFEVDILPSASNIWDLIPYSFVVDWFLPLGNKLEDIEKGHYIETLHPEKTFYSTKAIYHIPILSYERIRDNEYRIFGTIDVSDYERLCDKVFFEGTPCVEDAGGMTVTHGIEAGALLISRFF